ncbi:hypothetical protein CDV31_012046 [Fusarium ambrosium]|uniref:Uncharacterized protein n=1 Tax=Fusarium ambrosium TaxID=131363 RepID=A0A428TCK6_9HYPO|nr:hypothetical protein CDV31_012046 [Fusarium ambrosium]
MDLEHYMDTSETEFTCIWCADDIKDGEEHWVEEHPLLSSSHYHDDCFDEYIDDEE